MPVTIRPVGTLKSYIGGQAQLSVEAGGTVREALRSLGMPPEIVALVLGNESPQPEDHVLQDGDVVKLVAVIGGGRR